MNTFSLARKPGKVQLASPYMARRPGLGQADFMNSNLLSIATDFTAAALGGYVAYGLTNARNPDTGEVGSKWAPVFWVFSAMAAVKLLHDIPK